MESPIMAPDENGAAGQDSRPTFYIGHHDSKRTEVGLQLLQQSQDSGVSMPAKRLSSLIS